MEILINHQNLSKEKLIKECLESLIEAIEKKTGLEIFGLKYTKPDAETYNPMGNHIELTVKVKQ